MSHSTRRFRPWKAIAAFLMAAFLGQPLPAMANDIADWITQMQSGPWQQRLNAIDKLGQSKDRNAADALLKALDWKFKTAEEQEEFLLHVLKALESLGWYGVVDERALPKLEKLAKAKPTVMESGKRIERGVPLPPKYPYPGVATSAINAIRYSKAEAELKAKTAGMSKEKKLLYLAQVAWPKERPALPWLDFAAREQLAALDAAGIQPTLDRIPPADEQSQRAMADYFANLFEKTHDERCVRGLLMLAKSKHESVWQAAVGALGKLKESKTAGEGLLAIVEEGKQPGKLFPRWAMFALGELKTAKAVPYLIRQLSSKDEETRWKASWTLGQIGAPAMPELIKALTSKDRNVRIGALDALLKLRGAARDQALREFLKNNPNEAKAIRDEVKHALESKPDAKP